MLHGCSVGTVDEVLARSAGALCAVAGTSDVIDASVVMEALRRDDAVVTSDGDDLSHLLDAAGASLELVRV